MKVLLVFPETPRAAFNTARGWWNALTHDPDVETVDAVHSRGYYGLPEHYRLSDLPLAKGYDLAIAVWGYQVDGVLPPGAKLGAKKSAIVLTDEPYETSQTLKLSTGPNAGRYDVVASQDSATAGQHPGGIYLPVAWDPHLQPTINVQSGCELFDVGWVGGSDNRRKKWLKSLNWQLRGAKWLSVGTVKRPWMSNASCRYYSRLPGWASPGKGFLSPEHVMGLYRLCRVVLNVHRDPNGVVEAESPNPRVYECMALGVPCLNDYRKNLPEGCLVFGSPSEMAAFAKQLLAGSECAAKQAQKSVEMGLALAKDHTYARRWQKLREALGI
ncbi:MAG TPA: glycosyltransferase [Fimbriimonas sp.]|nr:glycosyltransferase [Fimbriimonas sp.]